MFHFFRRLLMKSFWIFLLIFFLTGPRLSSLQARNRGLVISCEPNEIYKDSGNVDILKCSFKGMVSQSKFTNLAMTLAGAASTSVYGMAGVPVSIFALSIVLYQAGQPCRIDWIHELDQVLWASRNSSDNGRES